EVQQDDGPIVVRTSFEPPDELRQSVDKALSDLVDAERPIRWERDEELICGVSVQTGARTLGWSVATYLTELENDFAELVSNWTSSGTGDRLFATGSTSWTRRSSRGTPASRWTRSGRCFGSTGGSPRWRDSRASHPKSWCGFLADGWGWPTTSGRSVSA